jgi:hypothetical protein
MVMCDLTNNPVFYRYPERAVGQVQQCRVGTAHHQSDRSRGIWWAMPTLRLKKQQPLAFRLDLPAVSAVKSDVHIHNGLCRKKFRMAIKLSQIPRYPYDDSKFIQ